MGGVKKSCVWVVTHRIPTMYRAVVDLYKLAAGGAKKSFLFGHLFYMTNVFCAKKRVGHACICSRMVTG